MGSGMEGRLILGHRPTIGWISFLYIGKSWYKMAASVMIMMVISFALLQRSRESIALHFMTPSRVPTPVIMIPHPDDGPMTAFDACAAQAATRPRIEYIYDKTKFREGRDESAVRNVYLYLWSSEISPKDTWERVTSNLSYVKVLHLDLHKVIQQTPIAGKLSKFFWTSRPSWIRWAMAGGSLLWRSGGIWMPTGLFSNRYLDLDRLNGRSVITTANGKWNRALVFGTTLRHHLLTEYFKKLVDADKRSAKEGGKYEMTKEYATYKLEKHLSTSINNFCEVETAACSDFDTINGSEVIEVDVRKEPPQELKKAVLLDYSGSSQDPLSQYKTYRYFQRNNMKMFCPTVAHVLKKMIYP